MRPSLVAVLVLSLVGLSGAAMSDGMPAAKKSHHKVVKTKVVKKHHRHGPECPPDHDDSWAIAEQLNHEEWLRHRQDDLHRRGGGHHDDSFSRYDDRYASDYAAQGEDYRAWDRAADDADLLAEAGAQDFQRDYGYEGRARRYVDKKVYQRYSSSARGYGWDGDHRGWNSRGHGWGKGEHRVHRSHGDGYAWRDFDRFGGGRAETRVYRSYGYGGDAYAGGYEDYGRDDGDYRDYRDDGRYADDARAFDEQAGRYDGARRERRVIIEKRYDDGRRASRYGHADDRLYDHGDYADAYARRGGYASSSYSSYGYGDGYGYEGGYGRGGYRFHYDAGYAGRDELGYLTWPGKRG
ncbi:MAG: hypothetical protein IT546_13625 [Caulobacteraceae bacterium]|nr:hypothetical protein [Caulobacteraceae bacterium]